MSNRDQPVSDFRGRRADRGRHDPSDEFGNFRSFHVRFPCATSVQNGVRWYDQLSEVFGVANVIGASASISGEMAASGEVSFTYNGCFEVGEISGESTVRVQDLSAMLQRSGVNSASAANILTVQWSKLVACVGTTSLGLLTRLETYKFASDSGCALVWARVMR